MEVLFYHDAIGEELIEVEKHSREVPVLPNLWGSLFRKETPGL